MAVSSLEAARASALDYHTTYCALHRDAGFVRDPIKNSSVNEGIRDNTAIHNRECIYAIKTIQGVGNGRGSTSNTYSSPALECLQRTSLVAVR